MLDNLRFRWFKWLNPEDIASFDYWLARKNGEREKQLVSAIAWNYLIPGDHIQWDDITDGRGAFLFRVVGRMRAAMEWSLSPGLHWMKGDEQWFVVSDDYLTTEHINAAAKIVGVYGVFTPTNK